MAKGKNLNPADAFRKSLRKKELKKNKAERSKARDFALVKKDTGELEDDIQKLDAATELTASDRTRLADLKSELENINRKKAEYVQEHPEQRRLVYRPRRQEKDGEKLEELVLPKRNLFNKHGLPRHPERSIYYDPVMNPFGVAPPGMPYRERPLQPGEVDSDDEEDDDDDEDIPMPPGPPPGMRDDNDDSDDDVPMPEGPPPAISSEATSPAPNRTPVLSRSSAPSPPLPAMSTLPLTPEGFPSAPPPYVGFPNTHLPPLPPPLPSFPSEYLPPRPPSFPGSIHLQAAAGFYGGMPPPPPGFPQQFPNFPPQYVPPPPPHSMPPPPPGFFHRRHQSVSAMQDPLSSIPHQTFQAHRAGHLPNSSLESTSTPTGTSRTSLKANVEPATIFAAPQLRDFKKEATAFVPTSIKRKKAAAISSTKINAAPSLGSIDTELDPGPVPSRPDLLNTLKDQFGHPAGGRPDKGGDKKDDYAKFVEEMGDILGPVTS